MTLTKPIKLYLILNALFLSFLLMAEVTGSKLFEFMGFTLTMGVVPFPMTFIVTDLLNEYYGRRGVRFATLLGMIMITIAFLILLFEIQIPASSISPVTDDQFNTVFGYTGRTIVGSITAFLIGQLIDIQVFHKLRILTKNRFIWLRATGSTIVSQLIDSFVVIFIVFSSILPFETLVSISTTNFIYKLGVAIAITPLLYLAHMWIHWYLGEATTREMIHNAMEKSVSSQENS